MVKKLYVFRELNTKAKLHLVKALVIPSLTYPVTPLNTSSITGMLTLQRVLNKALFFVYDIRWPTNIATAKSLHERARLKPINQIIHNRAKSTWDKIRNGTAADPTVSDFITSLAYENPNTRYPSSMVRADKDEPPPIYTVNDTRSPEIIEYYNHL